MHKLVMILIAGLLAASLLTTASAYQYQFRTIHAPGCGPLKITTVAGPAVVTLAPNLTRPGHISGYVITLDTQLLSFRQLYLRMGAHGCFGQK